MNIRNINDYFNTSSAHNQSFKSRCIDYTNAPHGTYLPKNQVVYISKDSVLLLGANDVLNGYIFGLGNKAVEECCKEKGYGSTLSVGRMGDIKVPDINTDVSRQHLEITQANKDGYFIKDTSTYGTRVLEYKDYTNKPDGTKLPYNKEVLINEDAVLVLGTDTILDLSSPSLRNQLSKLQYGIRYTIGRTGDIVINDKKGTVSRQHLEITKVNNYYVIKDISTNGTTIFNNINQARTEEKQNHQSYYRSQYQYQQYKQNKSENNNGRNYSNYQTPPNNKPKDEPDCSNECKKDLEEAFKPLKQSDQITKEIRDELRRQFKQLRKKYHPDINPKSNPKDFGKILKQFEEKGLVDNKGHWID